MKGTIVATAVRISALVALMFVVPVAAAAQTTAEPSEGIKKILARVAEGAHTHGDQELAKIQAMAGCSLSQTLESLAFQDPKGFQSRIDDTVRSIDAAIRTVDDETKNTTHARRLNLIAFKYATDLDLTGVVTQRDLLGRILGLLKSQQEALTDMKAAKNESDLARALAHALYVGGQISRMVTVYLTS